MPALFVFLLKVNIALLLFCAGYYLVLRHLTFYTLNRVYLLAAILFASVYPLINLGDFLQRHEALARPVQQVVINWQPSAQALAKTVDKPDYWIYVEAIFWIGASLLAIRLLVQLFSLYKLYRHSQPGIINGHQVRVIDKDAAPFSFWQSIFVNPTNHEPADLQAILLHEQVHVNQWHTLDILLAELSSIFYWFNPGIWLMKKAIRENVEFITDQKILKKGIDSKTYQYSLVSVSFSNTQPGIVNHFNLSTIKKRIIMMNAKQSSKINLTRYAVIVPVVVVLLLVFSISKADFVKKSDAFKSIKVISNNLSNAVGVTKVVNSIAAILPGNSAKAAADTAGFDAEYIKNSSDALWYLDGEPLPKTKGFADDTETINYVTAADAKKYFNAGDGKHMIAFATTKNSTAGKVLRERLAQLVVSGKIKTMSVAKGAVENVNNKVRVINADMAGHDAEADTLKKSKHFSIVTNSDSSLVFINGKRGKMKDVDPDDVVSVNVLDAKSAAAMIGEKISDNVAVVFITTKNSPEGLKLKEKLDAQKGVSGTNSINGGAVMAFNSLPLKGTVQNVQVYKIQGKDDSIVRKVMVIGTKNLNNNNNISVSSDDDDAAPATITLGKGSKTTSLTGVVVTGTKQHTLSYSNPATVTGYGTGSGHQTVVINSRVVSDTLINDDGNVFYIKSDNNKATPLIVIDGKEASSDTMKKLNPKDIKAINVLKSDDATKKYGDKAKQGVITIELKKK